MSQKRLVVIGNGMAGARTVEEILRHDTAKNFHITMFGDEPHGNYNRIMLSNVLSGLQKPAEICLNPLSWYEENGIRLHAPERVVEVDRESKTVRSDKGTIATYDILLFATGSRPFVPLMEGVHDTDGGLKHGVFGFRTLEDCHKIAGCANKCGRAVVIGGGLLGLEAARGLLKFGVEVHVVHIGSHIMNAQLDPAAGNILKKSLSKMGVHFYLGKRTQKIFGEDSVTGVEFDDGSTLECDMVVLSAGITPNVGAARDCGLSVNRAIIVNDQMRSVEDECVYAVGECAEHRGKVYGLVAPLWEQGQVFAEHITRKPSAAYTGSKIATKLKVAGVTLTAMGIVEPEHDDDEVVLYTETRRGIYQKLIVRDDILIGGILLGDTEKASSLMQAFDRGLPLNDDRRAELFDTAEAPAPAENRLLLMPDSAKVCNCMSLTKGAIRKCVEAGNRTLPMVQSACKVGTGCGSCKPLVQDIIDWVSSGDGASAPSTAVEQEPAIPATDGLPFGNPEVSAALKLLIREAVKWACKD